MALFDGSQRQARDKLNLMAGIERKPTGILASSPELIQAVAGAAPTMPQRPMGPAPVPMMQPALPQLPMQPALPQLPMQPAMAPAPAPRPMAPAPAVPTVPQPASPTTPMKFQPGGPIDAEGRRRRSNRVDITQDPMLFLENMDKETGGAVTEKYGSTEAALEEGRKKVNTLEAAKEATTDPKKLTDTVMVLAEVEPTDENKKDFATNVLGLQDVNDIDEINNRIAEVALYSSIGGGTTGTDKLAKALLLGLNNYKQTASARAAAVSGAKTSTYTPERLFQQAVEKIMGNPEQFDVYNDEGSAVDPMKVRREAMKIAQATSTAMTGDSGDNRMVAYDASGKPFYSTDGVNYVDAQGNPYVPPKE